MKVFATTVAALALALSHALAGDADRYDIVGFAQNGRVFVFEVFGTFDGSGGGHSTFYFIDTAQDKWLPGTPISAQVGPDSPEVDTVELHEIRERAATKSQAAIDSLGPIEPGFSLARQSLGQLGASAKQLQWREPYTGNLPTLRQETSTLALTSYPLAADGCRDGTLDITNKALGFLLTFNGREIYRDDRIPKSRGCPLQYFIEEVRRDVFSDSGMAIIAVFTPGFEGWDRGFVAVPLPAAP